MGLKKIIKEKDKITERYFIGASFMEECKIPKGYKNIADAVSSKLEDYCVFNKKNGSLDCMESIYNKYISDDVWNGVIETTDGTAINLEITQSYEQRGARLTGATVNIKYATKILKSDLAIIRNALTSSGLERL